MCVDSGSNQVGIGTNSLGEKLTISGNVLFNWAQDRKIYIDTPSGNHRAGDDLSIKAGNGFFNIHQMGAQGYNGGDIHLSGGDADGGPGGDGGNVYLYGGAKSMGTDGNVILAHTGDAAQGKVGIGTANPQGALDVVSTTGGFIVPRMTNTQQSSITAVNGMIIYDTTNNQFEFYENGAWVTGSGLT